MSKSLKELIKNDELDKFELRADTIGEWFENLWIRLKTFFVKIKCKIKNVKY